MNITDGEFYMVRLPGGESVHDERDAALAHLRENAGGLSADADSVSVVNVGVEGDDWQIKELAYQSVLIEILQGDLDE